MITIFVHFIMELHVILLCGILFIIKGTENYMLLDGFQNFRQEVGHILYVAFGQTYNDTQIRITGTHGACDVTGCVTTTGNTLFQACNAYTATMKCLKSKYDLCTGTAEASDMLLAMQAAQRPSDCQLDMNQIASSMTARNDMMTSMWKKSGSSGAFNPWSMFGATGTSGSGTQGAQIPPIGMMGGMDDGPLDDGPLDDGPFDDGPFDDGPFDDIDDMMGPALLPGLLGTGGQTNNPPPAPGLFQGGGAARQVDDRNSAGRLTVSTFLFILLPISVYLGLNHAIY